MDGHWREAMELPRRLRWIHNRPWRARAHRREFNSECERGKPVIKLYIFLLPFCSFSLMSRREMLMVATVHLKLWKWGIMQHGHSSVSVVWAFVWAGSLFQPAISSVGYFLDHDLYNVFLRTLCILVYMTYLYLFYRFTLCYLHKCLFCDKPHECMGIRCCSNADPGGMLIGSQPVLLWCDEVTQCLFHVILVSHSQSEGASASLLNARNLYSLEHTGNESVLYWVALSQLVKNTFTDSVHSLIGYLMYCKCNWNRIMTISCLLPAIG